MEQAWADPYIRNLFEILLELISKHATFYERQIYTQGGFGKYFPFSALNILENRELKTRWRHTRNIVWGKSIAIEAIFILLREFQAHWLCSGCLCQPQNLTSSPLKKCCLLTQVPYCPCPKYAVQSFFSLGHQWTVTGASHQGRAEQLSSDHIPWKKLLEDFSIFHDQIGIPHRIKCTKIAVKESM